MRTQATTPLDAANELKDVDTAQEEKQSASLGSYAAAPALASNGDNDHLAHNKCEMESCDHYASYGSAEDRHKRFCAKHKREGDVNLNTKQQPDPQLSELGEEDSVDISRRTHRAKKAAASTQAMNDAIKISGALAVMSSQY